LELEELRQKLLEKEREVEVIKTMVCCLPIDLIVADAFRLSKRRGLPRNSARLPSGPLSWSARSSRHSPMYVSLGLK
jgi:hypothetical protein